VTDASAFSIAASCLGSAGLATGITLRVLHRPAEAPMLGLIGVSGMLQIIACTLQREWFDVFWGLGVTSLLLGLLAWDAGKRQ
jgi:hypothetical protein